MSVASVDSGCARRLASARVRTEKRFQVKQRNRWKKSVPHGYVLPLELVNRMPGLILRQFGLPGRALAPRGGPSWRAADEAKAAFRAAWERAGP
jgi:hypothetical protein